MTISYADRFSKLLWRWKGSLWKSICKDLLFFLFLYYTVNMLYRFAMTEAQQSKFNEISFLFNQYTRQIPLTFLLGFYVAMVVTRWWEQFQFIAYPDSLLLTTSSYLKGESDELRTIRRTIARYCLCTCVLAWRTLSERLLKRFPTDEHLVHAGLMTRAEFELYNSFEVKYDPHQKWFVPIIWLQSLFVRCYEDNFLSHINELHWLLVDLNNFRHYFLQLFIYEWISIPLVYTQVATIATYGYFALCLVARQYPVRSAQTASTDVDVYIPIFTILQFLFYVGWLKVGEDLMNPFGEDDEDFELNYILDRHTETAYLLVDTIHGKLPTVLPDIRLSAPLAHTVGSASISEHRPVCHIDEDELTPADMETASPSLMELRARRIYLENLSTKEKLWHWAVQSCRFILRRRTVDVPVDDATELGGNLIAPSLTSDAERSSTSATLLSSPNHYTSAYP